MLGITNLPQCSVLMLWDFCAAMQLRTKHSVVFIIHCVCVLSMLLVQCTFVYGGPKMATFPAYCRASSLVKCERGESHCTALRLPQLKTAGGGRTLVFIKSSLLPITFDALVTGMV